MSISGIPTTKIQQKNAISKFSRISATNPPTKCYTREPLKALWNIETECSASIVEKIPTTATVYHVPHERIFVSAVFYVDKNVYTKVAFSVGSSVGSSVGHNQAKHWLTRGYVQVWVKQR